jgi:uncharacterized damage-inducible protein DinB
MAGMSIDMFIEPGKDPRTDPPGEASELVTLLGYLDWYRKTLELKCSGLDAEALARRSVEPSKMSLLGLVRHMSDVERGWFRWFMAGEDVPDRFSSPEDRDGDWDGAKPDPAVVDEAWQAWREEVAFAERFVAAAPSLEITGQRDDKWRGKLSLRWVLNHMIEEYARHIGHADLIRERIDGAVGQLGPRAAGADEGGVDPGGAGRGAGLVGDRAVGGAVGGGARFLAPAFGDRADVDGVVADRVQVGGDLYLRDRVVAGDGERGAVFGAGRAGQRLQVPEVDVVEDFDHVRVRQVPLEQAAAGEREGVELFELPVALRVVVAGVQDQLARQGLGRDLGEGLHRDADHHQVACLGGLPGGGGGGERA